MLSAFEQLGQKKKKKGLWSTLLQRSKNCAMQIVATVVLIVTFNWSAGRLLLNHKLNLLQ